MSRKQKLPDPPEDFVEKDEDASDSPTAVKEESLVEKYGETPEDFVEKDEDASDSPTAVKEESLVEKYGETPPLHILNQLAE